MSASRATNTSEHFDTSDRPYLRCCENRRQQYSQLTGLLQRTLHRHAWGQLHKAIQYKTPWLVCVETRQVYSHCTNSVWTSLATGLSTCCLQAGHSNLQNYKHNSQHEYLSELTVNYVPNGNLRSGSQQLLQAPSTKRVSAQPAFSSTAPFVWNNLSVELRHCTLLSTFRRKLKAELFQSAFAT